MTKIEMVIRILNFCDVQVKNFYLNLMILLILLLSTPGFNLQFSCQLNNNSQLVPRSVGGLSVFRQSGPCVFPSSKLRDVTYHHHRHQYAYYFPTKTYTSSEPPLLRNLLFFHFFIVTFTTTITTTGAITYFTPHTQPVIIPFLSYNCIRT